MAAIAAFESESYYIERVEETHRLRDSLSARLNALPGLRVMPSNINCILLDLNDTGWTPLTFGLRCRQENFFVVILATRDSPMQHGM